MTYYQKEGREIHIYTVSSRAESKPNSHILWQLVVVSFLSDLARYRGSAGQAMHGSRAWRSHSHISRCVWEFNLNAQPFTHRFIISPRQRIPYGYLTDLTVVLISEPWNFHIFFNSTLLIPTEFCGFYFGGTFVFCWCFSMSVAAVPVQNSTFLLFDLLGSLKGLSPSSVSPHLSHLKCFHCPLKAQL